MSPNSPIPAVAALVVALGTARLIATRWPQPVLAGRFASIDGLRGYLAFAVFLHHASIWHFFLRNGRWDVPPSRLYTHFGQAGVGLFFMVTGLLFFSKLLDGARRPVDWTRLYVSRLLRLGPLYLVAVTLMAAMAWILGRSDASAGGISWQAAGAWLGFTIAGAPDLFGVRDTALLMAGVTWTLPYEWAFYLSLPILSWLTGGSARWPWLAFAAFWIAAVAAAGWRPEPILLGFFGAGMLAAVLTRSPGFVAFARGPLATGVVVVALALAVGGFPGAHGVGPLLLLSVAFCLIAAGNTMAGALTTPAARTLGDVSYGVYLLHGLLLSALFLTTCGAGGPGRDPDPAVHWLIVVAATPVLVALAFAAHRLVELPALRRTDATARKLSTVLRNRRAPASPAS